MWSAPSQALSHAPFSTTRPCSLTSITLNQNVPMTLKSPIPLNFDDSGQEQKRLLTLALGITGLELTVASSQAISEAGVLPAHSADCPMTSTLLTDARSPSTPRQSPQGSRVPCLALAAPFCARCILQLQSAGPTGASSHYLVTHDFQKNMPVKHSFFVRNTSQKQMRQIIFFKKITQMSSFLLLV